MSVREPNEYVEKTIHRYSLLFVLPSHGRIVFLLGVTCLFGGVLTTLPLRASLEGVVQGLGLGVIFLSVTLLCNVLIRYTLMNGDPIFDMRRCSALSLFSCSIWFSITFFGGVISLYFGNPTVWFKTFLIGFCAALILRLVVLSTVSFTNHLGVVLSSLLQPLLCLFSTSFVVHGITRLIMAYWILLLIFIFIAVFSVVFFVFLVNRAGMKVLGFPSLPLFKAFMANWTVNLNAPLEEFLEKLGSEQDIEVSLLGFRTNGKLETVMVVPSFHPGPFKNIGSSCLPYMIQKALEEKLKCVISVPHGLSGHERDLSSQLQNQKVIREVLKAADFSIFASNTTPFVRVQKNNANASCQIFGDCALFTLTTAPKTTEDLPPKLASIITDEVKRQGLSTAILVDAHNSIEGPSTFEGVVESLAEAAVASLRAALTRPRAPFRVGAAKVYPAEFSVREGMGSGGISVVVVEVAGQTVAYITIDGNNMVSGLRERILSELRKVGINDGEVLTTDTHEVNGVVLTPRGYHPLGEAMDQTKLIDYILQVTADALRNLKPAEVSWRSITIPNVKVVGEGQIERLCLLAEETANRAKRAAVIIFSTVGLLLVALASLL